MVVYLQCCSPQLRKLMPQDENVIEKLLPKAPVFREGRDGVTQRSREYWHSEGTCPMRKPETWRPENE